MNCKPKSMRHRLQKRMADLSLAKLGSLLEENRQMAKLLERLRKLIRKLREQLGLPSE